MCAVTILVGRGSPELQQVRLLVRFSLKRLRFRLCTHTYVLLYSDTVRCPGDNSIKLGRTDASRQNSTTTKGACHYLTNRFQMKAPVAPSRSLRETFKRAPRSFRGACLREGFAEPPRRHHEPFAEVYEPFARLHIPKVPRRRLGGFTRPPRRVRG